MQEPEQGPIPFGRYKLVRRIGAGGMGEVFLARDDAAVPPRACVVKKVLPHLAQNRQFVGRFLDEAKVVVNLAHANIARVYAMGEVDGHYFLAMEYVQGKTVSRFMHRLRQRGLKMSVGEILLIGEHICEGLAYAHDANDAQGNPLHLVHRDLSPANVCVSYRGEVKIIDFGAAQSTLKEEQTAPRVVIGNLAYMSPEQARKQFVDRRSDVYSAAAVLWELFAWKPLPQKGDPVERWRKAANPHWDPPSQHQPETPREIDAVLLKALARDPHDRYPDAESFGAALKALRMQFAPKVDDAVIARSLRAMFSAEKGAEDASLQQMLRAGSDDERPDQTRTLIVVPPTALAFEHVALDAPEDFVPEADDEVTQPGVHPHLSSPGGPVSENRVGFGVSFSESGGRRLEPAWVREIEGESGDVAAYDTGEVHAAAPLPAGLVYVAAFLGALGAGFLGVWFLAH